MLNYFGVRIIHSAASLFGLIILVFFLARLTGDPTDLYLPIDATAAIRADFRARHGFDDPVIVQFGRFVRDLLHMDFGTSITHGRPALEMVLTAFPTTLLLTAITMSIALTLAIVTGALAALKPGGVFDRISTFISLLGASAPSFWIAIVGILFFAVWLRWLPTSGTGAPIYWVLPILVLILRPTGMIAQVVRGSMISALSSPYVKTARSKGASTRRVTFIHALRNAMLPVITVASDQAAGLVNGAVIVETIFGFPGIGKLMIDSIIFRDFAVLQAAVAVTATAIFVMNIVVDILYALLDPRIRYSS